MLLLVPTTLNSADLEIFVSKGAPLLPWNTEMGPFGQLTRLRTLGSSCHEPTGTRGSSSTVWCDGQVRLLLYSGWTMSKTQRGYLLILPWPIIKVGHGSYSNQKRLDP